MTCSRLVALCVLVCSSWDAPAAAQVSSNGSIRGHVRDQQRAVLPGVTLTARSAQAPHPYTAVTDGEGFFRLLDLVPGTYEISAELAGFAKVVRSGILVRAGLNLGLDLDMTVGAVSETVTVSADTPVLESSAATNAINISGTLQRELPLAARREWHEFLLLTPGVIATSQGQDSPSYFSQGAGVESNVFLVDGVEATSAGSNRPNFTQLNTDIIEDVQIKTAGVDAASPLGTGAVMSIATQSGTNQLRGSATALFQARSWNANNEPGGTTGAASLFQPDLAAGGPVRKDRVWWFGTYRYRRLHSGIARTADQLAILHALAPDFEPFDNENLAHYYFLKTTTQLSPRHQLNATYQYDMNPRTSDGATTLEPVFTLKLGGPLYSAKLTSTWTDALTTRVGVSYNEKSQANELRRLDVPTRPIHRGVVLSAGRLNGTGAIARLDNFGSPGVDFPYEKTTIALEATYYRDRVWGSHEIGIGGYLQPVIQQRTLRVFPANGFQLEDLVLRDPNDVAGGTIPFHRRIYDAPTEPRLLIKSSDYAFYVQDAWRPVHRVTVTAGVRVDVIRRTDELFDIEVQRSVDVGPRVGVNYALTADRRNILRGSWGRVHDGLISTSTSSGTNAIGFRDTYDLNLDGTFETVFETPGRTALRSDLIIDASYHQPFVDEWTLGLQRQWPGGITSDVNVIRRSFRELRANIGTNAVYEDGVFRDYRNQDFNEIFLLTNNVWNWPVFSTINAQVAQRSRWVQFLASYTRQWRHLEGGWEPNNVTSFLQPEVFPNDRAIEGALSCCAQQFQDYVARLAAVVSLPGGITIATNYNFQSGPYSFPIQENIAAPDPRFGPATVTLSNGRLVSNPLATTLRYANPTRGDGQLKLPGLHVWNVRVGHTLSVGRGTTTVALDVFNLTNNGTFSYFTDGANQLFNPNYGLGFSRQTPRAAQVSLRVGF